MPDTPRHRWIIAPLRADRSRLTATLDLPARLLATVDAHRRIGGPYTAASTVLTTLVPQMLQRTPELVRAHDIEVLSAAPDLRGVVPATRETLTSLSVPEERTRFYSRLRTLRIANGLVELLRDHVLSGGEPRTLVVENAEHADPTDAEWLAVLLRRVDPRVLTLVVRTSGEPASAVLGDALHAYCEATAGESTGSSAVLPSSVGERAALYVDGDATSDDPELLAAYRLIGDDERAALHDARATRLEAEGRFSPRLGAIPFHRERGADPENLAAGVLRAALNYCITMGFYDATIDFGQRGRDVVDWQVRDKYWWAFTTKITISLAALGRPDEAKALYDEARVTSVDPAIHMGAAYATAMLYTRHFDTDRQSHTLAKAWINQSIAFASLLPDPEATAMQTVFHQNGLALIEVHLKNLPEALRLVTEGLARLDRELGPDKQLLHRSVLLYNRAQVLAGLGMLDEALAEYTAVIVADPHYAEYYLDRGNILRRLGRDDEALADYETAIRMSPPFPEVHYNRADMMLAAGEIEAGLAGLGYVIELDPAFLDAYVNRAGIFAELGDHDAAARDVATGLALDPDNPHLHCVRGQLHAEKGEYAEATAAFDAALARDPALQAAWAGRAAVRFDQGDPAAAVADLTRAIEIGDDAALRYNRATAYQATDRRASAVADLRRALELAPDDPDTAALLAELSAS
ncbi:tetratricopeptide (TPR) repeat protein [Allocatelliglobosispora scoriae]|uniref:Tetratricopeptide (TPR) repeat protein n=1 Tax=Allocatelliglobosispora scoriae TaxID=643052 RepID=A0A841BN32_9ACTN|nr:tetratricopeptide repeat protein [Allocatelliglobosispora scoriae]MBB5868373.1 tetratricopeptide (TPR) repeat protein [Allocatelliglobosispora scoriae]